MLTRAPTLHNCIVDSVGPYQTATLSRLICSYPVCCHMSTNLAQLYSEQCRSLPDSYFEQAGQELRWQQWHFAHDAAHYTNKLLMDCLPKIVDSFFQFRN
ncbi:hypothetical protein DPMN_015617 [Dreissena polymorpha]|uniref:Uncharacterized protein n=1 Tax=Dreissena polymorpha TaxID=45954 RepID=A0A9D4N840_DREPO|nr:hypothetical protein DPMN_015617 [Dreissena polymorpha]